MRSLLAKGKSAPAQSRVHVLDDDPRLERNANCQSVTSVEVWRGIGWDFPFARTVHSTLLAVV